MDYHYKRIIIALDGSKISEKALQRTVTLALDSHATLILAHVVDTRAIELTDIYDLSVKDHMTKNSEKLLNSYEALARKAGIQSIEKVIRYGSPRTLITEELIPEMNPDLIVIGATALTRVEEFMVGSVSENVSRHANCDVLIIR